MGGWTSWYGGKSGYTWGMFFRLIRVVGLLASTTCLLAQDAKSGGKLFEQHCTICHGIEGKGGRGPRLNRPTLSHAPDEAALRRVIADGLEPAMPGSWFFTDEEVANLAAYVRTLGTIPQEVVPGDPQRGQKQYSANGCASCHVMQGEGGGFGVSLSDIGSRLSAAGLREALLKPAASVPDGFLLVEVTTDAGKRIRGMRLNEDTFTIQLRDASGKMHSFRNMDLREIRKLRGESPMPSYQNLTPEALQDLIAYLASRK